MSFFKLLVVLTSLISLTGCIAENIINAGSVIERMEPQKILIPNNGTIVVKVDARYVRKGFMDGVRTDFNRDWSPWANRASRVEVAPDIPLKKYTSRNCYIVLNKPYVDDWFKRQTTETLRRKTLKLARIYPSFEKPTRASDDITIIPKKILGEVTSKELNLNGASEYQLTSLVPFRIGDEIFHLNFSELKIESNRSIIRWWVVPIAAPVGIVEELGRVPLHVVQFAAMLVAAPFMIVGGS